MRWFKCVSCRALLPLCYRARGAAVDWCGCPAQSIAIGKGVVTTFNYMIGVR